MNESQVQIYRGRRSNTHTRSTAGKPALYIKLQLMLGQVLITTRPGFVDQLVLDFCFFYILLLLLRYHLFFCLISYVWQTNAFSSEPPLSLLHLHEGATVGSYNAT